MNDTNNLNDINEIKNEIQKLKNDFNLAMLEAKQMIVNELELVEQGYSVLSDAEMGIIRRSVESTARFYGNKQKELLDKINKKKDTLQKM